MWNSSICILVKYNEAFSDNHCLSDNSECKGASIKGIHLLDGLKSCLPWMISLETSMYSKKYHVIYSFPKTGVNKSHQFQREAGTMQPGHTLSDV